MSKPQHGHRFAPIENQRKLVPVRAVAVEAADGIDRDAIEVIIDSGIALYRTRVEVIQAVALAGQMFNLVAVRLLHTQIDRRT